MATNDALKTAIEQVLAALRPAIQAHGGNVELVKFEENIVYVRLTGACIGCPISSYTIKLGIEDALKAKIPEVAGVIAIE